MKGFVVGVSGGIDSALVSTLCALTGAPTFLLNMPINQAKDQYNRADNHIRWLMSKYKNVSTACVSLGATFGQLKYDLNVITLNNEGGSLRPQMSKLALANAKARLRMTALYAYANSLGSLVVGTGNKVEDFGVGFFTKYGDGGIDLSPIGDLLKTEVRGMAAYLGVDNDIVTAVPTDGLWEDNRSDEAQIGCSYEQLEEALTFCEREEIQTLDEYIIMKNRGTYSTMTPEFDKILQTYLQRHTTSKHKMDMPPVCHLYE
jgi:NAD+ synthase